MTRYPVYIRGSRSIPATLCIEEASLSEHFLWISDAASFGPPTPLLSPQCLVFSRLCSSVRIPPTRGSRRWRKTVKGCFRRMAMKSLQVRSPNRFHLQTEVRTVFNIVLGKKIPSVPVEKARRDR
ncbi:unnamed protein product [Pleuronectes platessa]|uniref:Uncharacterized protein n=1 Tax=Pleuronectes platessa TaxID=8262 RepID=A0A9N7VJQ1_PLEPL|nr:unnamed protein product [Pleuronectes platessa]